MTSHGSILCLTLCVGFTAGTLLASRSEARELAARRADAAAILANVLTDRSLRRQPGERQYERYADACRNAAETLGSLSYPALRLTTALQAVPSERTDSDGNPLTQLANLVRDVHADLTFEPLVEADVPRGFPVPTPAGEIEVKRYPPYRMAQAQANETSAFWTLFRHIKTAGIAMTAPVQMQYAAGAHGSAERPAMAFLYGSPDLGRPGADGNVQVVDVAPMKVLSLGMRGKRTEQRLRAAQDALSQWLKTNANRYEAAGGIRVMGYNSPFVPASRRYFEVQIPLREMTPAVGQQGSPQPATPSA